MRQFLIAADSGSFRTAAAATFRSAAAVSTAIRDLEAQVGAPLFEPGQRARITPLAQVLRPLFQELVTTHDRVLADARQFANSEAGSLSLAVVPFLAEDWLPGALAEFIRLHPGVKVRVTDERSRRIRRLVADGDIDIGVGAGPASGQDERLEFVAVANDVFGVACADTHPFARHKTLSWSALAGERIVANDAFETLIDAGLGDLVAHSDLWISSRPALMDSLRRGVGVSVLPRLTKPDWAPDVTFVPLIRPRVERSIGVMVRSGKTPPPAAARMVELIVRSLRDHAKAKGATIVRR